jgi:hypothetical protein
MPRRQIIAAFLAACGLASIASAQAPQPPPDDALASTLSQLIRDAIPLAHDKQQDWGATREVTVGYRVDGKPFHYHVHRRKKAVAHGVWKHYKLRVVDPEQDLQVRLGDLRPVGPGRMAFTLDVQSKLDAWARAKVYQYGVHLIALEVEGDVQMRLQLRGEVALEATAASGSLAIAARPVITDAKLSLDELRIRRVSDARGPLIRELSDGVRSVVEDQLNGPQLTARLNRAIEKKRDRLVFAPADLVAAGWWKGVAP